MKKSIGIIAIMVLLMISLFCVPASASTDGDFTYTVYAPGEVTITSYNKYGAKNVVIPATIEGYPVVKIGTAAFARTEITSVILPDSITSIGNEAFESCKQLETVVMPKHLKTIGWEAFQDCSKIAKINIPQGVEKIEQYCFSGCLSLKELVVPSTLKSIATAAFDDCGSLNTVWYLGGENDKSNIIRQYHNDDMWNATWHYNSCPVGAPHEYSNDCDDECNGCGLKRDVPEHTYDNACDTDCNVCKAIRQTQHTYDNSCDTECNICKSTRNTTHSYGQWNTVRKADCTTSGAQNRECSVCHNIDTKSVDPLNHDYETKWTVDKEETCTEAGSKSHHCIRCDATKDITTIKPSGHAWGKWVTVKEATTAEEGRSERTCTSCQKKESQSIAKLAEDGHVHKFGEWDIKKVATCAEQGKAERKCSICEETESKDIVATGHQVGDWEETAPTCIKDGYRIRKCLVCGNLEKIVLNALGHKYDGENICVRCEAVQEKTEDSEIMGDIDNNEDAGTFHTNKIKGYYWMIWVTLALVVIIGLGVFLIKRKNKTTF